MNRISVIFGLIILDYVSDCLLKKIFKNNSSNLYILFLQIPKICGDFFIVTSSLTVGLKCVIRLVAVLISLIFLTDSFKITKILKMIITKIALEFSIIGFCFFVAFWMSGILEQGFSLQLDNSMKILTLSLVLIYIILIYHIVRFLDENKKIESFLANVSLNLLGKHIRFYALVDSGNSLIDPLTKKPVLLISKRSLERFISEEELEILIHKNRSLKCQTISETRIEIPIISVKKVFIDFNGKERECKCVLGIVENKFEKGKYDCLLPRDII